MHRPEKFTLTASAASATIIRYVWCVIITFLIFVPISPPPSYPSFLESDNLFSNLMDHFICIFLYLVFFFCKFLTSTVFFGSRCPRSFLFVFFYYFASVLSGLPFLQIVVQDHFFTIAKLLSYQITILKLLYLYNNFKTSDLIWQKFSNCKEVGLYLGPFFADYL